jgi:CBS domain-containing protein
MIRVTRIADIMTKDLVTFASDLEINHAVSQLLMRRISGAPVVDDRGQLLGVLTTKDCFKAVLSTSYYESWGGVVSDYMSGPVETMDADLDIVTAAEQFLGSRYRRFPVVEAGRLVGVISRFDLLRAFYEQR